MNFEEFQKAAMSSAIKADSCYNLLYASNALCGEAGEFANMVKKVYRDNKIDDKGMKKEIFDILWYTAYILDIKGWNYQEILDLGFAKLAQRKLESMNGHGEG